MNYSEALASNVNEDYLPPLTFVLPLTREDFAHNDGVNNVFFKLCDAVLQLLPPQKRQLTVIQRTTFGERKLKSIKVNLPQSCEIQQQKILALGIEVNNKKLFPVRGDKNYTFYPCKTTIRVKNVLPNLKAEEVIQALSLPEKIEAQKTIHFSTMKIGNGLSIFDGTATIMATISSPNEMEAMKEWSQKAYFEEKFVKDQMIQAFAPGIMECKFCKTKGHDDSWCRKKKVQEQNEQKQPPPKRRKKSENMRKLSTNSLPSRIPQPMKPIEKSTLLQFSKQAEPVSQDKEMADMSIVQEDQEVFELTETEILGSGDITTMTSQEREEAVKPLNTNNVENKIQTEKANEPEPEQNQRNKKSDKDGT